MKNTLYVVAHKEFAPPTKTEYLPIQVGRPFTNKELGFISDDSGENISLKNKNFCELTALYWIWKNDKDSDRIGLCHYRRYFFKKNNSNNLKYIIGDKEINKAFEKHDIILPKPWKWQITVAERYYNCAGKEKDLNKTGEIIREIYPEFYSSFEKVINSKKASYCNMAVMKKADFNEYCEWLFAILFKLEEQTDLTEYTPAEARIFGYLSEILINVWVDKKGLKVKYFPIQNTEAKMIDVFKYNFKLFIKGIFKKNKNKS